MSEGLVWWSEPQATRHGQLLPRDVGRGVAHQEGHRGGDVVRLGDAAEGRALDPGGRHLVGDGPQHGGLDGAGEDRVHADPEAAPLLGGGGRQGDHPGLAGRVVRLSLVARRGERADGDHAPGDAAGDHGLGGQLHGEEGPHQVHVDHLAELLRGHVGDEAVHRDAGAGDQAVDRTARQDVLEDGAERGLVGDVGGVGVGDADVGPVDDDRGGTGLGQHGCGRGADASGTAGHDDASVVERGLEHGGLLPSERVVCTSNRWTTIFYNIA